MVVADLFYGDVNRTELQTGNKRHNKEAAAPKSSLVNHRNCQD